MDENDDFDFDLPGVNFNIDVSGAREKLAKLVAEAPESHEIYEVTNSARHPVSGRLYWRDVNYGTGPKFPRLAKNMIFSVNGKLVSTKSAGPNPPHHMRERALPLIQEFAAKRAQEILANRKPDDSLGKSFIATMEATMDYSITQLAKFTPILQRKYYDAGFEEGDDVGNRSPAPGLLRNSYGWRMAKDAEQAMSSRLGPTWAKVAQMYKGNSNNRATKLPLIFHSPAFQKLLPFHRRKKK